MFWLAGDEGEVWFSYNPIETVVEDLLRDASLDGLIDWDYKPLRGLDSEGFESRMHGPFSSSIYFEEACRVCRFGGQDSEDSAGISTKAICISGFSDTTNVLANCNAYPIFVGFLNVNEQHRKTAKAVRLAGLIPIIEGSSATRKSQILHQCIARVFAGFNEIHEVAKMRLVPTAITGNRIFLAFWAADLLEHWNLRCMVQGNCILCKCPKDQLGKIMAVGRFREQLEHEDSELAGSYPRYESKEEARRFHIAGKL